VARRAVLSGAGGLILPGRSGRIACVSEGNHLPVIGLVGGIGAGKSSVARQLGALGCAVIDADRVGHALLDEPAVAALLREQWGDGIFNQAAGQVDRQALGRIVFGDPAELGVLERILHPPMRQRFAEQIAAAGQRGHRAVVLDAAVLFEAGWDDLCDAVLFVDAPQEVRLARACKRRGWDEATFHARQAAQMDLAEKARRCDATLDAGGSLDELNETVRQWFARFMDNWTKRKDAQ
jgi:dephospho-CoA kinase